MIEEDVMHRSGAAAMSAESVGRADGAVARTDGEMLDRHVMRFDDQSSTDQSDSGIGRRLTCNGKIWIPHEQRYAPEIDDTADLEDNEPRPAILQRLPKGAPAACVERRYTKHYWSYHYVVKGKI